MGAGFFPAPIYRFERAASSLFRSVNTRLVVLRARHRAFDPIAPALKYATYVTAPLDTGPNNNVNVLGGFPEAQPFSLGDANSTIPGTLSVSWGDLVVFFYKHALGGNTKPNPAFFPIAPALEWTTYVTCPGDTGSSGAPSVLGGYPEGDL
jgi:hypothetical protein